MPSTYTLNDFRIAMSVQFLMWGFGAWMILRYRQRSLARVSRSPGAMEALRDGDALLPGISRDHED
jgi:hypothetical protein